MYSTTTMIMAMHDGDKHVIPNSHSLHIDALVEIVSYLLCTSTFWPEGGLSQAILKLYQMPLHAIFGTISLSSKPECIIIILSGVLTQYSCIFCHYSSKMTVCKNDSSPLYNKSLFSVILKHKWYLKIVSNCRILCSWNDVLTWCTLLDIRH